MYSIFVLNTIFSGDSLTSKLLLLFAVGPAVVVYEASKEFTDEIIERTLEQHVAIARANLELTVGGDFDDWYSGESEAKIDKLDQKSQNEVITALCSLIIGASAPIFGYVEFGMGGLIAGVVVLVVSTLVILHALGEIVDAIERTTKVVNS